ncbi:MAG: signal recognition particle-docking protein FtsY [Puniceicoccales bacterium]|jgi:fused signal recognition particle receptor|nr:signal recognition particle-docking protein FtsY [Puniceicoccales bacterium]
MFRLFSKVRARIESAKNKLTASFKSIFHGEKLDPSAMDQIEALLYSADIGVETTENILAAIRSARENNPQMRGKEVSMICQNVLFDVFRGVDHSVETLLKNEKIVAEGAIGEVPTPPLVIGLIGTNGSGKTTTAAKLAGFFRDNGKSVIVGACDTFRAAANEQIRIWAEQLHFDLVESQRGADPASVAFDTCQAAISRGRDVVILDTAGRLHNKSNLMAELAKMKKVIGRINSDFPQHLWLVADAHLGTNTITSAQKFHEELGLTGMIITKLDGTSRGGAIVGIYQKLRIPVYFIGTGEGHGDLMPFVFDEYVRTLVAV